MTRISLIIFVCCAIAHISFAQERDEFSPIDKKLNLCLENSSGVIEQNNCLKSAIKDWSMQMDEQYLMLLKILPTKEK